MRYVQRMSHVVLSFLIGIFKNQLHEVFLPTSSSVPKCGSM